LRIADDLVHKPKAAALSPLVQKYLRVNISKVVLEHVRVIDRTGRPASAICQLRPHYVTR
jgi:hypothetical protein